MAREKLWTENINLTLPAGAKARMDAVVDKDAGEDRLSMIRTAIDAEVERREKRKNDASRPKID